MLCDRIGMDVKRFFSPNLACMNTKNVKLNWNRNGKNGYLYICIFYLTHHLHFILHMQRSNLFWDNVFPSVTIDVNNYLPRLKDTYPGPFLLLQRLFILRKISTSVFHKKTAFFTCFFHLKGPCCFKLEFLHICRISLLILIFQSMAKIENLWLFNWLHVLSISVR